MGVWAAVFLVGLAMVFGSPYSKEGPGRFPNDEGLPIDDDDPVSGHHDEPDDHA